MLDLPSAISKLDGDENILSLFPRFFPLWGYIDPYIFRDAITMCAPELRFHFHGECQPNILPPNRSVDRYEEDNFLPSFIFCWHFVARLFSTQLARSSSQ